MVPGSRDNGCHCKRLNAPPARGVSLCDLTSRHIDLDFPPLLDGHLQPAKPRGDLCAAPQLVCHHPHLAELCHGLRENQLHHRLSQFHLCHHCQNFFHPPLFSHGGLCLCQI